MNQIDTKKRVIEILKTLPICKVSTQGMNYTVRCPYCGDSKHASHGHFSILVDTLSDRPMMYRCFKCNDSGLLTSQTLEDLNTYVDRDTIVGIDTLNRFAHRRGYYRGKGKKYGLPTPDESYESLRKLDYINRRLGLSLTTSDCEDLKIILHFSKFLEYNSIPIAYKDDRLAYLSKNLVYELDRNYVGFVSSNCNKIVFRDITDGDGKFGRYYKVTIDLLDISQNTFYGMAQFPVLYSGPVNIHIAEGTFDIISIIKNLNHPNGYHGFFASCGYSFSSILKYAVSIGVTTDLQLHVYSDSDKSDSDHLRLLNTGFFRTWVDHVTIHRNGVSGEKDFGVPLERIQDYSYSLNLR